MKFRTPTIKDIARALGTSKSTVSRALNNDPGISAKTKTGILEYAERINFHANKIASGLKEGRSNSIGIVVSEIANTFFSRVIDGVESVAFDRGYMVIITQSYESSEREKLHIEHLCSHAVDGLLVSISNTTRDVQYLKEWHQKGLPMVFFDKVPDDIETHKVITDNYQGAYNATEHLIQQGFKRIAHITAPAFLSITKDRLKGYKAALKKHRIPFDAKLVKYCNHGEEIENEVRDALESLFSATGKPDAIFTASGRITIACNHTLEQLKLKRGSVGVAGFSNNELYNSLAGITIVQQRAFQMGKQAAEFLFQIIENKYFVKTFETKVLETDLLIADSSIKPENKLK